jgi:putative ABC transport system substrate-binding protein
MKVTRPAVLLVVLILLAPPLAAWSRPVGKVHKIGYLAFTTCGLQDPEVRDLRDALASVGHVEGKDVVIECRVGAGQPEHTRVPAEELVRLPADPIVAAGTPSALAAQRATATIPIVFYNVADPVGSGLVTSLARPGGNVTGLANLAAGQTLKGFEVLKEGVPQATRVAVLTDLSNKAQAGLIAEQDAAARALGLTLQRLDVRGPSDLDRVFAAILRERAQALYLYPLGRTALPEAQRITAFATKHRLPTLGTFGRLYLSAGVLFFYSHSLLEQFQRLATQVDRILKGARPADLPVEQPTKFELVVNVNTAKAIGLELSPSLLLRADRVLN